MRIKLVKEASDKETEFISLPNPPGEFDDSQEQLEEVTARFKRRAIKLTDEQDEELRRDLFQMLSDWRDSRAGLKQKLQDRNDLFEGVVPFTDYPWQGASQLHIPYPKIKVREITSTINRTTMRPVPFLMTRYCGPDSLYDSTKSLVKDLENFVEDKIKNDTNVHETLKDAVPVTIRDGTSPIQITWDTEYETVRDYKLYEDAQEFASDYPDSDSAGIPQEKYRKIVTYLASGGKYEVEYEYDVATYDGPRAYLVSLIDFVHWPINRQKLDETILHGKRVWYTDYQLEDMIHSNRLDDEPTREVITLSGDEHEDDTITISRDQLDGLNRTLDRAKAKEYEFYELVWKGALNEEDKQNGIRRKYLIRYHWKSQTICRIENYPVRKGKISYFILRLIRRDNRLLGMCLMDDMSDLSKEIDIGHRQRINTRTITHVPSFKAKKNLKNVFDPGRADLRFKPGVTYYLDDPTGDVIQFDIRPVDLSGSAEDELMLYQLVDMVTGSSSALSGQSNPIDPRAPARKQQELLRQSTNRLDDYVQALLPVFEEIGQHIIDLYYQYGSDRIKYYVATKDGRLLENEMDRSKLFNPNVMFKVNGTSVFMSPEAEYDRWKETYAIIASDPLTAQNPRVRKTALERLLNAGRVEDSNSLLPNQQDMDKLMNQPNPANPNAPPVGTPGMIPTEQDKEAEISAALQEQKLATRVAEGAEKRQHQQNLEIVKGIVNAPPVPAGAGGVNGA